MSPSTHNSSATGLAVVFWIGFIAATFIRDWGTVFDAMSTDDALRLVQVRDLLGGQNWFDLVQHRLDPPNMTPMHWSRLIDAPIALLIKLFSLALPYTAAETMAIALWPPLLMLPALLAMIALVRTMVGDEVRKLGLLFFLTTVTVYVYFSPAHIDHHNAQVALILWMTVGVMRLHAARGAGIYAGLAGAVSVAIGPETTPLVLILCASVALMWLWKGGRIAGVGSFGLAFGLGTALIFVATTPPPSYATAFCDSLSIPQAGAALLGGFGLALASLCRQDSHYLRFALLAIVAALSLAPALYFAPQCLANPLYTLPENVSRVWLTNVSEAQNVFQVARNQPSHLLYIYLLPVVSLGLSVSAALNTKGLTRARWFVLLAVQSCALLITLWQIRGGAIAHLMAIPSLVYATRSLGKAAAAQDWEWLTPRAVIFALVMNGLTMVFISLVLLKPFSTTDDRQAKEGVKACTAQATYLALDQLPIGRIANTIDTGPFILAWSPHSAIAGPYHRQIGGLSDTITLFRAPPAEAEAIVRRRQADYVLWCQNSPETSLYSADGNSLMAHLERGETLGWLQAVPLGNTPLRIYRVIAPEKQP
jgi:hypothetical protein